MSVDKIIRKKRCFLCGTCVSICPTKALYSKYNEVKGFYEIIFDKCKCINCGLCNTVCPSTNSENQNDPLGKYKDAFLAYSNNASIRKKATSGGVISSIIIGLIENEYIDEAYILKADIGMPNMMNFIRITKDNIDLLLEEPRTFATRYTSFPINIELGKMVE